NNRRVIGRLEVRGCPRSWWVSNSERRQNGGCPMLSEPIFSWLAIPAVVLLGLSKGGFAGVGAIAMPLLALRISPVQAAGILLPVLIVQDAVSVWAFRKDWARDILALLIPSALVGIVLAYLLAAKVSATA